MPGQKGKEELYLVKKKKAKQSENNTITRTTPGYLQCEVKGCEQKYGILKV